MSGLLADLAAITLNGAALRENPDQTFALTLKLTPVRERASRLLRVDPARNAAM